MSDIKITETKQDEMPHENISMREVRRKKIVTKIDYEVENKEVSKNIQKFDKRARVYKEDPYTFNYNSLKRVESFTPTASQMVADPLYNSVGKVLGLDNTKEWNQYYDKVYEIAEWARKKVKTKKIDKIIKYVSEQASRVPQMGSRRIDDLYIYIKL